MNANKIRLDKGQATETRRYLHNVVINRVSRAGVAVKHSKASVTEIISSTCNSGGYEDCACAADPCRMVTPNDRLEHHGSARRCGLDKAGFIFEHFCGNDCNRNVAASN